MTPLVLLPFLAVVAAPWLFEARRRRIDDALRDHAPGRFVALSQGRTHYLWHGPDTARTLVLVHGTAEPSWVFAGLTRGLVIAGYRVLTYDLFGRGFSDRAKGAQTLAFHTRQLGDLLAALGVEDPVTLLGYDLGGAIATQFAADQSDRVERLILISPADLGGPRYPLLGLAMKAGGLGRWLWRLFAAPMVRRQATFEASAPTVIPDLPKRMAEELRRKGFLDAMLSSQGNALATDLKDAHREIAAMYIPTLAIWGEEDSVIPPSAVGDLARWNRKAHQEVVPSAGHGLVHTHPKEVLEAIRTFLHDIPD